MKLQFSNYDFEKFGYQTAPGPSLNGGLYTGEPFEKGALHGNAAVTPEATYHLQTNLSKGNTPPLGAQYQYPATRMGNSYVEWKGLKRLDGTNIFCAPCNKAAQLPPPDLCPKPKY